MPEYTTPGVYVEELSGASPSIVGVPADGVGFVGVLAAGPSGAQLVSSVVQFEHLYRTRDSPLAAAAHAFFGSGGARLWVSTAPRNGKAAIARALAALASVQEIGLVAAPAMASAADALVHHAEVHQRFAFVDAAANATAADLLALRARLNSSRAAIHHPWLETAGGHVVASSGFVAGMYAHADLRRGVWKPPTGNTVPGVARVGALSDPTTLSAQGINVIREIPGRGAVLWGARTTSGDAEWKYVGVRRTVAFLERSIEEGARWAVFEPSSEPLWTKLRTSIEDFLTVQWRAGALQGRKREEAFFVRCDRTTMTQADLDLGHVVCLVGCAVVRPAEFAIVRLAIPAGGRAAP